MESLEGCAARGEAAIVGDEECGRVEDGDRSERGPRRGGGPRSGPQGTATSSSVLKRTPCQTTSPVALSLM
jgi:hypothetical protein